MTRQELGARVREIRVTKNLTRDQLASKCELSSKFIYEIEKGKKGLSVESLMKLAKGLSCNCDEILIGEKAEE